MAKLLLIGAASALGRRLSGDLSGRHSVRGVARRGDVEVRVDDYLDIPQAAFEGVDVVINCVGTHSGPADLLTRVNVDIPRSLVTAARNAGVSQFIHFSSLKVYGYAGHVDGATEPVPTLEYGWSKLRGEQAVIEAAGDDMAVSIIRPPAVYGHGSGANIAKLVDFMARFGFFVAPIGDVRRSVANIENVAPVIERLIADKAPGVTLIADTGEMTLKGLARLVTAETGKRVRVLSLPAVLLFPLRLLSRPLYNSLFESQIVVPTYRDVGVPLEAGLSAFVRSLLLK